MKKLLLTVCLVLMIKANVYVKVGDYVCLLQERGVVCWGDRVTQG